MRIALLVACLLALTGCTPAAPPPTLTPAPSSTRLFASDAEALKAATAAYAAYLRQSDLILNQGGQHPERLLAVASSRQYASEKTGFAEFEAKAWKSVGATTFSQFSVQTYANDNSISDDVVVAHACIDQSKVDVVDRSGSSVVSTNRPSRLAREIHFDSVDGGLVVSRVELWDGAESCQ